MKLCFVCASHNENILRKYLLSSPMFNQDGADKTESVCIIRNETNIARAYNTYIPNIKDGVYIYIHHDVYLPNAFKDQLIRAINEINRIDPNWGVLGVAGVKTTCTGKEPYGRVLDRGIEWAGEPTMPHEVDTLDELILITHGDFTFDEELSNHFYGADICMQAITKGRKNYVIDAYCHHNSGLQLGERPDSFWLSRAYFREKYFEYLPIATTCTVIRKSESVVSNIRLLALEYLKFFLFAKKCNKG